MGAGQRLVVVVDDDRAVRDSLKFALELEGFDVRLFNSSYSFLADMPVEDIGCVVLDHDMPIMGGFELLARLKALNRSMPTILMTDHATDAMRRRATLAGVRHVVEKPLLGGALIESLHDVLRVVPATDPALST